MDSVGDESDVGIDRVGTDREYFSEQVSFVHRCAGSIALRVHLLGNKKDLLI